MTIASLFYCQRYGCFQYLPSTLLGCQTTCVLQLCTIFYFQLLETFILSLSCNYYQIVHTIRMSGIWGHEKSGKGSKGLPRSQYLRKSGKFKIQAPHLGVERSNLVWKVQAQGTASYMIIYDPRCDFGSRHLLAHDGKWKVHSTDTLCSLVCVWHTTACSLSNDNDIYLRLKTMVRKNTSLDRVCSDTNISMALVATR